MVFVGEDVDGDALRFKFSEWEIRCHLIGPSLSFFYVADRAQDDPRVRLEHSVRLFGAAKARKGGNQRELDWKLSLPSLTSPCCRSSGFCTPRRRVAAALRQARTGCATPAGPWTGSAACFECPRCRSAAGGRGPASSTARTGTRSSVSTRRPSRTARPTRSRTKSSKSRRRSSRCRWLRLSRSCRSEYCLCAAPSPRSCRSRWRSSQYLQLRAARKYRLVGVRLSQPIRPHFLTEGDWEDAECEQNHLWNWFSKHLHRCARRRLAQ